MLVARFARKNTPVFLIGLVLFFIPFFWFQPGAMDLGGDGTRLYYYDPVSFMKHAALYSIALDGKGDIDPAKHSYLGYVLFISGIKYIVRSASSVISIFSGLKLSIGFISMYFIVREFIQRGKQGRDGLLTAELPALLAGFFYILATGSEKLIFHWANPLHSHDQVLLNPLIFFLLLNFLLTQNRWYLWGIFIVSLLFSSSFAMISSPPFFAFYPLAYIFLFLYVKIIRKIKIPLAEILFSSFFFLGLHAFHLIPEFASLFANNTMSTAVVFKESGVNYFNAIRGLGVAVVNLFIPSSLRWASFIAPLVIIVGFLLVRKKDRETILTSFFFFITFFLVTANITHLGIEFYRRLFQIPGFAMFRNFYLQWGYVFIFFYALLFGQSLSLIFKKLKPKYIKLTAISIVIVFFLGFWPFLSGQLVDGIHWGSKGVKTAMIMDPKYEQTLKFIRDLPDEGKMLVLPLTDNYIQVLFGLNNAAYVGPSTIPFLTGKQSFAGYQHFWPDPIPEKILGYAREKNYNALLQIFSLFNIRYIFHNADPKIYEEKFPQFPNSYMMTSLPKTQAEYKEFIQKFPVHLLYNNGPFEIYELDKRTYRSEVYIPDTVHQGDMLQLINNKNTSFQSAFLGKETCQLNEAVQFFCSGAYESPGAVVMTRKINPTEYVVHIKQSESVSPFLLVFQNSYHQDWKLSIDQNPPLGEEKHISVNKYANAWIIAPDDRHGKNEYDVHLTLTTQRYSWYGLWITGVSLSVLTMLIIYALIFRKQSEKN